MSVDDPMASRSRMNCLVRLAAVILLFLVASRAAAAQPASSAPDGVRVSVKVGNHRGYGRIAYEFAAPMLFVLSSGPGWVKLEVEGAPTLPLPERLPRNVLAIRPLGTAVELDLAAGARARAAQVDGDIVVDVLDPPRSQPIRAARERTGHTPPVPAPAASPPPPASAPPVATAPTPAAPSTTLPSASASSPRRTPPPASLPASLPETVPAQPTPTAPPAAAEQQFPAPSVPGGTDSGPISVAAVPLPSGVAGALLPFPPTVGAAAFRRGGQALLVFDARQPLDLAQVADDPVLGAARVELLPSATLVRFPLAADVPVRLERAPDGWNVRLGAGAEPPLPSIQQSKDEIVFGLADPSQVVVVPDPESRTPILVGTVRPGSGSGAAMEESRRTPSFRILPTWLGVAVEALSDRVQLSTRANGFALSVPSQMLAPESVAGPDLANASGLTRVFDFPDLPTDALRRRMDAAVAAAATAPPRGRLPARLAAAQAMIALGLGAEAEGLLATARADNPEDDQDSRLAALQAIAALLDRRIDHAGALNDPRLTRSDEITFWRAILAASTSELSPTAATAFAATIPLVISYPETLRDKLLPLVAETMALGGQEKAADVLLARFPDDPALSLAHALCLEAEGATGRALASYDQLATGRDRLVRVRAGTRAAELRHRSGTLNAAGTADALDRLLIVWRGDQRELSLRLRIAELRTQAGQFRPALELLRETQVLFPGNRESIKMRMGQVLQALLSGDKASTLKPLEFISIAEDFAEFVPTGEAGDRLAGLLASRLVALDLPGRAAPVLDRLVHTAPAGAARARFGLQLARMRLEGSDPAAALAALQASDAPELPAALAEERGLALARAQAKSGNLPGAASTLSALGTASADDLRASLLEGAKDWPGALAALRDLAAKRVAMAGPLSPEQQEIVLREASAALQAGDQDALRALRQADESRMGSGSRANLFRLLTDGPVQSPADLPRAAREIALAAGVPESLKSLAAP